MATYHAPRDQESGHEGESVVTDTLESIAREGARRLLERMLAEEVDAHLGRPRYAPGGRATGYRNGYARQREIGIGTWSVPVRAPRVSDLPEDSEPFLSTLLPRGRYFGELTRKLFARLYLEGLSSGDFEPAMRELMGERATLSASTILRLKTDWAAEYVAWQGRHLSDRYAYLWCDGIYLGAGLEPETSCVLVVIGARDDGSKELLAMELGYRESTESWAGVLRSLRQRGLVSPLLAIGDGALGLWAALSEVFPTTGHQRCWNHKVMNYDYPAEHWRHLRTSNVVESVFAGVRIRTNVAKRSRVRENALYLVFKIVQRLAGNWHKLDGGATLMTLLLTGARFRDGILVQHPARREEVPAAA